MAEVPQVFIERHSFGVSLQLRIHGERCSFFGFKILLIQEQTGRGASYRVAVVPEPCLGEASGLV